ncbi:MAG TPA: Stk1 family PASTA domain-containing Ser/Thr kinase [Miltoncostaeaceae bacterium]|nr:Stk1 family PASTA domain-containing Ser/Thr kinase [Miltoncostaeaceae bacterium]
MSFQPGELIGGRYELGRQLGAGGMARVYLGHDRLLDREVAVKVLAEPYASDPNFVERFRREASAAAGLNHPNIVAVYDRGEADGSYYIVMEYLAGPDLKQVIRSRAPLPPTEAIDAAQQILAALGAAHRRDLVHRDVKPQNVLVAEDGHLKVTDFGIARAGAESDMTEAGSVIGTAQYLSPEQARGDEVTAASDTYAVGIVLYEMLTGRVPFDGGPPVAVAMKQISDEPVSPRIVEPSVPRELEAVVMRSLAKRPSERYRTVEEMSRALAEARGAIDGSGGTTRVLPAAGPPTSVMGAPTAATRVGPPPPPAPPPRRRRWPLIAGILVLLVAVAAAAFVLMSGDDAKTVTIPPVKGQTAAAAETTLRGLGLEVDVRQVTDPAVEQGLVIDSDPAAGEQADVGDTVILRVSSGPGDVAVPDVVDQSEADATAALRQEEFTVNVEREASDGTEEGRVIRQDPAGGTQAQKGSEVTIVVSTGPAQVTVPSVRALDQASAEQRIRSAGLEVGSVTFQPSQAAEGTVISQDPAATAKVDPGTRVNLVIAQASSTIQVPDVVGNLASDATFKLENAGFKVVSDTAQSDQPVGTVIEQNPSAGTQVARDTVITITVSNGPSAETGGGAVPAPPPSGDQGDQP